MSAESQSGPVTVMYQTANSLIRTENAFSISETSIYARSVNSFVDNRFVFTTVMLVYVTFAVAKPSTVIH